MATHPPVPSGAGDYTSISTIGITFLQASHDTTGSIQRGLNAFYAEELGNIDAIFHTSTVARDSIAGNAMDTLFVLIIAMVTANADHTPPASVGRIATIVRHWRIKFEFAGGKLRNLPRHDQAPGSLRTFLNRAVVNGVSDLMVYIQTEDFFVDPDPMIPITYRNFDHFSPTPFAAIPGGVGASGAPSSPRFYFNPAAIPTAPRLRYEKRVHSTRHVLQSELVPYLDTGLPMNYYVDGVTGQSFVLRDGTMFELMPLDEKGLFREPPRCADTSGPGFRHWYDLFSKHCLAHGYYVHPYILFKRDVGGNRGFICARPSAAVPATAGSPAVPATPAVIPDLPLRLAEYIDTCNLSVWTLLNRDKMFPEKSAFGTIVRKSYGKGYEALRLMIMQTSPLFSESPGDHVRSPPNQPAGKSLTEYYIVFRDYMAMSALVNNVDISLDDANVIDMFISGTLDYQFFKRVSREHRHQPSQAHRFRDESIVSTLEEYLTYPDYTPAKFSPPRTREWYKTSGRSLEPRSLNSLQLVQAPVDDVHYFDHPGTDELAVTAPTFPSVAQINALGHVIPPPDADLSLDRKYRSAVYAINQRPASNSSPCLVCGEKHRFDACPVLLNIEYLQDHYIKFCSFLKRAIEARQRMTNSLPPSLPVPPADRDVHALSHSVSSIGAQQAFQRDQNFYWRQV